MKDKSPRYLVESLVEVSVLVLVVAAVMGAAWRVFLLLAGI